MSLRRGKEQELVTRHDVIIAGVGGRGALTIAQVLAQAAAFRYKNILWYPNYTTARRGAPADATVIFSNEEITSPLVSQAQALVVVESSRVKYFEHRVQPNGWIFVETFGLKEKVEREDVNVVEIPAVEMAARLGDTQVSNFILLGVYAGATKVISPEFIKEEIERRFKGNERMLLLNSKAFEVGQGWLSRNRQAL